MVGKVAREEKIHGYAFVDAVSKPVQDTNPYRRQDIVLDVISTTALIEGTASEISAQDLFMVRIMTTPNRLRSLFLESEIEEGSWFSVTIGQSESAPLAWVLSAENDYGGPIWKANVIDLKPLPLGGPGSPEDNLRNGLQRLCSSPLAYRPQSPSFILPSSPSVERHFVRVVDVGHANFSAIHVSCDPDSLILGYFDVGGPVFFHNDSFPKVFNESHRIPELGFVALSHWDFDHYSLAATKLTALQKLRWYAPDQTVGPNAARLQSKLGTNLTLLTQKTADIGPGLRLWKGTAPTTDRNSSGYALTALCRNGDVLLTGDIEYGHIPSAAKSHLSALGITHHGGSGGGTPPSPSHPPKIAAVSYGIPNRYRHPDEVNLQNHATLGWEVRRTFASKTQRGDVWLD